MPQLLRSLRFSTKVRRSSARDSSHCLWCEGERAGCCDGVSGLGSRMGIMGEFFSLQKIERQNNGKRQSLSLEFLRDLYLFHSVFVPRLGCHSLHLVTFIVHCHSILAANRRQGRTKRWYWTTQQGLWVTVKGERPCLTNRQGQDVKNCGETAEKLSKSIQIWQGSPLVKLIFRDIFLSVGNLS